jgi:mRNA-degrading endonuclease RelE of RelBE toxin-antitoxin system
MKFSVVDVRFVDDIEAGIPLTGDLAGCYKIKIVFGNKKYRAIYEVLSDDEVVVVFCGPRKNAYETIKKSGVVTGKARQKKKG